MSLAVASRIAVRARSLRRVASGGLILRGRYRETRRSVLTSRRTRDGVPRRDAPSRTDREAQGLHMPAPAHEERFIEAAPGVHLWADAAGARDAPALLLIMGANATGI